MATWEEQLRSWAQSPSKTETERMENAEQMVRNAIDASQTLSLRDIKVFAQGSYRNRTNIPRESDVDVGVLCKDTFYYDLPDGFTKEQFSISPATYHYPEFKNDVQKALSDYFGAGSVTRGSKAFDIKETSYHVDADVAPFFEHRRYNVGGIAVRGVKLHADDGRYVENYPDYHFENGKVKNEMTGRRYRAFVRILKNIRCEMSDTDISEAKPITSFLCECLVWNVPGYLFGTGYYTNDFAACVKYLAEKTSTFESCKEWGEVSELKYLFWTGQKWTREQANAFLYRVLAYLGAS